MSANRRLPLAALAAAVMGLAACTSARPPVLAPDLPSPEPGALSVVATTTVFADFAARVGGSKVSVRSLVPKGGDVHTFDPTPATFTAISDAGLIVANGLGLDDGLTKLVGNVGSKGPLLRLGEEVQGVDLITEDGTPNPHLWLDVEYARRYAARIATALQAAEPASAGAIAATAAAYDRRLADLDGWVRDQLGSIPEANRKVISLHDAFPYFARAYGLEVVGSVITTPGQDPSAGEIADLVARIRASGARAIFSEIQFSDKLARTIADETGVTIESNLYDDSLGDAPADSYEGVMRWDVERIVAALR